MRLEEAYLRRNDCRVNGRGLKTDDALVDDDNKTEAIGTRPHGMLYTDGDEYDGPGVLGRMSDEPSAKIYQTRKHIRMCSEGVFRCVSDRMGIRINGRDKAIWVGKGA